MKAGFHRTRIGNAVVPIVLAISLVSGRLAAEDAPKLAEASAGAIAAYSDAANLQNNRRYELAAMDWEKFLETYPDTTLSPQAQHYAGVCWLQLKEYEKAAPHFQAVVDKWKNVPDFTLAEDGFLNLGWCRYQLGLSDAGGGGARQFADAAATFLKSLKEFPQGKYVDQVLYFLGDSLYLQSEALFNESQTLRVEGKLAEAEEAEKQSAGLKQACQAPLKQLVEKHPKSTMRSSGIYALGVAYEETGNFPRAAESYADFLKEFPDHDLANEVRMRTAETVAQRGMAARATNSKQAAESLAEAASQFGDVAAVEGFDQRDHAIFRQADCLAELEEFSKAARLYARLASDFPRSEYASNAVLNAGRYLYRDKKFDEARAWLERSVAGNTPDSPEAAHWLCRIHLRDKQPQKAIDLAAKVLPHARNSDFLVDLKLDQADALYENPSTRSQALPQFQAIAADHPDHRLAPQALYNAAFTALDLKQYDVGKTLAEIFLSKFEEDVLVPDVKYIAAECNLLMSRYGAAAAGYRDLLDRHAAHDSLPVWRIRLAWALYLQNKYAQVAELVAPVIDKFKASDQIAEARHLLGASQFSLKKYGEAESALAAALAADPNWRKADATLLLRSQALFQLGKTRDAVKLVQQLIRKFPGSDRQAEANYRLGEFAYKLEDYDTSVASYGKVLKNWTQSKFVPYSFWGKGWSELKQNRFAEAAASFTGLINNHPQHELVPDANFARGMCRRHTGDNRGAIEDLDQSIASGLSENYAADARYEKGQAQAALKDLDGAAQSFAAALQVDPQSPIADKCLYELAWARKSNGQTEQAIENFSRLVREYPKSSFAAEAHFHVGDNLYRKKDFASAADQFREAVRQAGSDSLSEKALYKLGWSNYELKNHGESLKNFQAQVEKHPEGSLAADALVMVAENLFNLKNHQQAWTAYNAARDAVAGSENATGETQALVLLHGGQTAVELKRWDDALQMLRSLVAEHPGSSYVAQAKFEIGVALLRQNKYDEAVDAFEQARIQANLQGNQGLKARSLYMKGEAYFAKKDYQNAVKTFDYTTGIFSGNNLNEEVKKWLGYANFEAGQCHYILISDAQAGSARHAELVSNAKKYFGEVVTNYPNHALAEQAKKQLALLAKFR